MPVSQEQRAAWEAFRPLIDIVRGHALAVSSWSSAATATGAYLAVCAYLGLDPVPPRGIPDTTLCAFITYLTVKKYSFVAINNYLSMGPRILSLRILSSWISIKDRPMVQLILSGAKRLLGTTSSGKLPITLPMLTDMLRALDDSILSKLLTAAALVAFWAGLRKSNITVKSYKLPGHCIKRQDITFAPSGRASFTSNSSKNNQFRAYKHVVQLPLFQASDPAYSLCPSRALRILYADPLCAGLPGTAPAISYMRAGRVVPLTHDQLIRFVKTSLSRMGFDPSNYAGQSFRKGFGTLGHQAGLSDAAIQNIGDWHSSVFQRYIFKDPAEQLAAVSQLTTYANDHVIL